MKNLQNTFGSRYRTPAPLTPSEDSTPGASIEAPTKRPDAIDGPAPRGGASTTKRSRFNAPLRGVRGFMGRVAEYVGQHDAATSAVLIGATAAPLLAGVPVDALARPVPTSSPDPAAPPEIVLPSDRAPPRAPEGIREGAPEITRRSNGETRALLIRRLDASSVRLKGMHDALVRARLERAGLSAAPEGATRGSVEEDLRVFDHVLDRIETLTTIDSAVPPGLIADVDGLVDALLDAPEGAVKDALHQSFEAGTFTVDAPEVITATPDLDTAASAFRRYFGFDQGRVRSGVRDVVRVYEVAAENTIDRLPTLPDASWTLSRGVSWSDGQGNRFRVPAGARVAVVNDEVSLTSVNLGVEINGTRLRIREGFIRFGRGQEALGLGALEYRDSDRRVAFEGLSLSADRRASELTLATDRAEIDFTDGTLRLGSTRLTAHGDGDLDGEARGVALRTGEVSIAADELTYALRGRGGGRNALEFTATNATIGTEDFSANLDAGAVTILEERDGSAKISANFTDVDTLLGGTAITTEGRTRLDIHANARGEFTHARFASDAVTLTDDGNRLNVEDGALKVTLDDDGRVENARGRGERVTYRSSSGETFSARGGHVAASFYGDGQLESLTGKASRAAFAFDKGEIVARDGEVKVHVAADGALTRLEGRGDAQWRGEDGNFLVARGGAVDLRFSETNTLRRASFSGDHLEATLPGGETLATRGTSAEILFGRDGALREINAETGDLRYEDAARGRSASADGVGAKVVLSRDGLLRRAHLSSGALSYTGDGHRIHTTGRSELTSSFTSTGALKRLNVASDRVTVSRRSNEDHDIDVSMKDVRLGVDATRDGHVTVLSGREGMARFDGHTIDMGAATRFEMRSDGDGVVEAFEAKFPDRVTFEHRDGDLAVRLADLNVNAGRSGGETHLRATFAEGHVALRGEGLTANIKDAGLTLTDGQVRMHVSRAEVLKSIGERFNVEVEGLDVVVDYSDRAVRGLDLEVEGVEGAIKEVNFRVRSRRGDRVRLNLAADADGNTIKRAFLEIPDGGEVELHHDDFDLRMGPQTVAFTNEGGAYRLRGEGLDITAATAAARVKVTGGTADVALDKSTGALIIHEITGTDVNVKVGGQDIDINIADLDGYLTRVTGASGGARGASIHLLPTSDRSRINMEVRSRLSGVPVKLSVDDAHELKSFARLADNEARVYIGDPSGRGDIHLSAGPLSLRGSAIEVVARYEAFDSHRMTSILGRLFTTDGFHLTRNLTIEPDGVIRLGTVDAPVIAEVAVLLPKGTGATPAYVFDVGDGASDGAFGAVGRLGVRGIRSGDADYSGSIFVGAVPASYLNVTQPKGSATLFGVPLPRSVTVPTTGMAGVTVERKTEDLELRLDVGGFVNPASLAPADIPLRESTAGGFFTGLRAVKDDIEVGADAVFEVDRSGNTRFGGARVTFGVRF